MAAGHLHMRQQGIQSTRKISTEPGLEGKGKITKDQKQWIGTHFVPLEELKGMIATDQTGQFPIVSITDMQCIMVLYNYDSNVILAQPCRSRTGLELTETYNKVYKWFIKAGVVPVIQQLDNKVSGRLIESIEEKNLDYQLASPHTHRLNPAERAI